MYRIIKSQKKKNQWLVWPDEHFSGKSRKVRRTHITLDIFREMAKFIMKFNQETGKTAKLVQQSG